MDFKENTMRMKARISLIVVILGLTTLFSCEQWLELIPPQGLIREEFWQSKEDVEAVIMGAYETFSKMDALLFRYGELRADMVTNDANMSQDEQKIMESNIYPDNWLCDWSQFYEVINYCNEVIKNAPLVQDIDKNFSDFFLQGYLSEAYFLRSLAYFYLVRVFKDVPYVTEPTESDDANFYIPKTDGDSILMFITEDLMAYRKYATIEGYQTLAEQKGRATRAAYDALLADIALWSFDYPTVVAHVDSILNSRYKYVLMTDQTWFQLYYPGNSDESIFEFQFNTDRGQNNGTYGLTNYYSNNYDPSQRALELFEDEPVRGFDASVKRYGEDDFIIWKYIGRAADGQSFRSGTEQSSANWIVYRLADVMLMKAEALSQMGRYQEATNILSEIRENRGSLASPPALSAVALEDAILFERSVELAYEGKRWFDLMRMGRRNDFARKSRLIEIIIENVPSTQKRILQVKLANPLGWYLPISEWELERNRELEQNPYYNF